jgi:hypothetical protein
MSISWTYTIPRPPAPVTVIDSYVVYNEYGSNITSPSSIVNSNTGFVHYVFYFSKMITGLQASAFSVTNGVIESIPWGHTAGQGFDVYVRPNAGVSGALSISLLANSVIATDGGAGAAYTSAPSFTIDTVTPTVTISKQGLNLLNIGNAGVNNSSAILTFTLSEASTDFTADDITVSNGQILSNFTGSGTSYTAVIRPRANSTENIVVSVNSGRFTDAVGNGNTASNTYTMAVDTVIQTITITSNKSSLRKGETSILTFTTSEGVGHPSTLINAISVSNGQIGTLHYVVWPTGATQFTAVFTATDNVVGSAVINVAADMVDDWWWNRGNAAASLTMSVDTLAPSVVGVTYDSRLASGATIKSSMGEINYLFEFSEEVMGLNSNSFSVSNGSIYRIVRNSTNARIYNVGVLANNGVASGNLSLQLLPNISDNVGNVNSSAYTARSFSIDTLAPTVESVISNLTSLSAGSSAILTFNFSENVSGFDVSDIEVAVITNSGGGLGGGNIQNLTGTGRTYTAVFVPDYNRSASVTINVLGGVFSDAAGNVNDYVNRRLVMGVNTLDTIAPSVVSIVANKESLRIGDTAVVTFTLSEPVLGFTVEDVFMTKTMTNGRLNVAAPAGTILNFTGSGTQYTMRFVPDANSNAPVDISVHSATFQDRAGNQNITGYSARLFTVDTAVPTLSSIVVNPTLVKLGDTVIATFTFSEAVQNFDVSDLLLGGVTRTSNLSGTGANYTAAFIVNNVNASIGVASTANYNDLIGNVNIGVETRAIVGVDTIAPSLLSVNVASGTTLSSTNSAVITFTLSEASPNFSAGSITISNATVSGFTGSGVTYTATVRALPGSTLVPVVSVAASRFTDSVGNQNTAFNNFTLPLAVDTIAPSLVSITSNVTSLGLLDTVVLTFNLSESVSGFMADDFSLTNLNLLNLTGSGTRYTGVAVASFGVSGSVSVSVGAGQYTDLAGNQNQAYANGLAMSIDTRANGLTAQNINTLLTQYIALTEVNQSYVLSHLINLLDSVDALTMFDVDVNSLKSVITDASGVYLSSNLINDLSDILVDKLKAGTLTATFLTNLRVTVVQGINGGTFDDILSAIPATELVKVGNLFFQNLNQQVVGGLSLSQITQLQPVLSKFSEDTILGLSTSQISGISFTGDVKPISLLSDTALSAVSVNSIQKISGTVLVELSADKLSKLNNDVLLNLTADQLANFSQEQLDAILAKQVPTLLMNAAQLQSLDLSRLAKNTIASLVPKQIRVLLPNISNLSADQVSAISYQALNELHVSEFSYFSQDQLTALPAATLGLLDAPTKRFLAASATLDAQHHWNQAQIDSLTDIRVSQPNLPEVQEFEFLKRNKLANRNMYLLSSMTRDFIEAKYQNLAARAAPAVLGGLNASAIRRMYREAYVRADYSSRKYTESLRHAYQGTRLIGSALQIAGAAMAFEQAGEDTGLEKAGDILQGMAWLSASLKAPSAVLYAMYKKYGIAYDAEYANKLQTITVNDQLYIDHYDAVFNSIVERLRKEPIQSTPNALSEQQINIRAGQLVENETKIFASKIAAGNAGKAALPIAISEATGVSPMLDFFQFRKELRAARGAVVNPLGLQGGAVLNARVINVIPAGGAAAVPAGVAAQVANRLDGYVWRTRGWGKNSASWVRGMIRGGAINLIANGLGVANGVVQTVEAAENGDGLGVTFNLIQTVGSGLVLSAEFMPMVFQKTPVMQRASANILKWGQIITFTAMSAYDIIDSFKQLREHPDSHEARWRAAGSIINTIVYGALFVAGLATGGILSVVFTGVVGLFLPNWANIGKLEDARARRDELQSQGREIEANIYSNLIDVLSDQAASLGLSDGNEDEVLRELIRDMNTSYAGQSDVSTAIAQAYNYALRQQLGATPMTSMVTQLRQYIIDSATADQNIFSVRVLSGEAVEARTYYADEQDSERNHNYVLDLFVTATNWTTEAWDATINGEVDPEIVGMRDGSATRGRDGNNWLIGSDLSVITNSVILSNVAGINANSYELVKVSATSEYGYFTSSGADDDLHPNRIKLVVDASASSSNRMYSISSNNTVIRGGTGNNQYYIDGDAITNYKIFGQGLSNNDVFITALDTSTLSINLDNVTGANVSAFAGRLNVTGTQNGQSLFARSERNTISMTGGSGVVTAGGRGNQITMAGNSNTVNVVLGMNLIDGTGYDHQGWIDGGAYTGAGTITEGAYNRISFAAATQGVTLVCDGTSSIATIYDANHANTKIDEVSFAHFQEIVGSNLGDNITIRNRSDIASLSLGVGLNVVDVANSSDLSIFTAGGINDIQIHNELATVGQQNCLYTEGGETDVIVGSHSILRADLGGLSDIIDFSLYATADMDVIQTRSGFHKIYLNTVTDGLIEMTAEYDNNHTVVYEKDYERQVGNEVLINLSSFVSNSYIDFNSTTYLLSIYSADGSNNQLDFYAKPRTVPSNTGEYPYPFLSNVYIGMVNDVTVDNIMYQVDTSGLIQAMNTLGGASKGNFDFNGVTRSAFALQSVFNEVLRANPNVAHPTP